MPARQKHLIEDKVVSTVDKLRAHQTKAKRAQKAFKCTNCFVNDVGRSDACLHMSMCDKCFHTCHRETCTFCKIDFLFLDWMNQGESRLTGARIACVECIENRQYFGDPKRCDTCSRMCAFQGVSCPSCTQGRDKYGEPDTCEMCQVPCAFRRTAAEDDEEDGEDKYDGLILCVVCKRLHKLQHGRKVSKSDGNKESSKATGSKHQSSRAEREAALQEDKLSYRRYADLQDQLRRQERELKSSQQKAEMFVKQHKEKSGEAQREVRKKTMKATYTKKKQHLERLKDEMLEYQVMATQQEKRSKIDIEGETVRHDTEMASLLVKQAKFVQDTDRLQHENTLIQEAIIGEGRFPKSGKYPWQVEDEAIAADKRAVEEAKQQPAIMPAPTPKKTRPDDFEEAQEMFREPETPADRLASIRPDVDKLMDEHNFRKSLAELDVRPMENTAPLLENELFHDAMEDEDDEEDVDMLPLAKDTQEDEPQRSSMLLGA